jgi:hypothetical protein
MCRNGKLGSARSHAACDVAVSNLGARHDACRADHYMRSGPGSSTTPRRQQARVRAP